MEKRKSRIVYTVRFDPATRLPVEVIESVIAVAREDPATGAPREYYVFCTEYRLSQPDGIERFELPREAARLLR